MSKYYLDDSDKRILSIFIKLINHSNSIYEADYYVDFYVDYLLKKIKQNNNIDENSIDFWLEKVNTIYRNKFFEIKNNK